ncbi:hypothetical protein [Nonomuraea sp. NPDC049607]|uniref:hypothetical protein n=1 Tax=unclassified Nonomuraea TaxID=2593643 RepID=UPI003435961D
MKKTIFGLAATMLTAATITMMSSAAQAEPLPSGCNSGVGYQHAYTWANCSGGGGYVRAVATCASGTAKKKVYSSWKVNAGDKLARTAYAHCPSSYPKAVGHSYDIKR